MAEIHLPPLQSLSFTIKGQPIVKKNNQRVVRAGTTMRKIDTPAYTKWRNSAYYQIAQQLGRPEPITEPVNLCIQFYMETRRATDLSNLLEGVQDVLVTAGILSDDNYNIVAGFDGTRGHYNKNDPRMEVIITPLEI